MYKICAIIPSLNPDEKFMSVVDSLMSAGLTDIIVVDDGSKEECKKYFHMAESKFGCRVLTHCKNLGKGRALKTAFNYFLNTYSDYVGVVTVDADNQHQADDVVKCCHRLMENSQCLVLGVRDFTHPDVPTRSRTGNKITCTVFRMLCGLSISDTQTGLRALSRDMVYDMVDIDGERYEYETNMLIETKKRDISISEVGIKTVYIDDNSSSHFNPLRDSFKIYMLILKFLSASLSSCLLDMGLFVLFVSLFGSYALEIRLLIATVAARVLSSLFNYLLNKNIVFGNRSNVASTIIRYYTLCLLQMSVSYAGVYLLSSAIRFISEIIFKIIVDFVLFLISFQIQREWVFRDNGK